MFKTMVESLRIDSHSFNGLSVQDNLGKTASERLNESEF